jgi:hypothetical protein
LYSALNGDRLAEARVYAQPMTLGDCLTALLDPGPRPTIDHKVQIYECRQETVL